MCRGAKAVKQPKDDMIQKLKASIKAKKEQIVADEEED
jgi:hypothetical protein